MIRDRKEKAKVISTYLLNVWLIAAAAMTEYG